MTLTPEGKFLQPRAGLLRSPLGKVDSVALISGKSFRAIYAMADGGDLVEGRLQWVWNMAVNPAGSIRDLHDSRAGRVYVHAVTQLEISSTELRQIIVAGRDPRYLVPDPVRVIIRETGCYASKLR